MFTAVPHLNIAGICWLNDNHYRVIELHINKEKHMSQKKKARNLPKEVLEIKHVCISDISNLLKVYCICKYIYICKYKYMCIYKYMLCIYLYTHIFFIEQFVCIQYIYICICFIYHKHIFWYTIIQRTLPAVSDPNFSEGLIGFWSSHELGLLGKCTW